VGPFRPERTDLGALTTKLPTAGVWVFFDWLLHWWTGHGTERAEYATIALLRFELRAAASTDIKKLTGVSRHDFKFDNTAVRARDRRLQKHDPS
jgi:hypothetical protein